MFVFDLGVSSQQEALEVGQRDMHPGEQFVGGLTLLGQRDGSVPEAVLLDMPVTLPAVSQHMAAGSDSALEEAIQTARSSVGQHRKSGKSGHRRTARLPGCDVNILREKMGRGPDDPLPSC